MSRRHLPVVVDRAVAEVVAARTRIGSDFATQLSQMVVDDGPALTCRKGCNNCCMHPTTATLLEGAAIYTWLVSHGRWTPSLRKHLAEASDKLLGLSFAVWLLSAQPCVFLAANGSCSVYSVRPIQCRTTFSVGDAEDCHPHRLRPNTVLPRIDPLDEFSKIETEVMQRIGLQRFQVPLATAVLFAEKLYTGEADIEQIDAKLMALYAETT